MAEDPVNIIFKEDNSPKSNQCQTANELSECLKLCLKHVLDSVTDENFVSIYKACYKEFEKKDNIDRPALSGSSLEGKKYRSQFNEIITRSVNRTIEEAILDVNPKLKELEELKQSQSGATIVWRPPGNAFEHITPFEYVSQMELKKELEDKIEREQETLRILKSRLNQKRMKAAQLHEVLLNLIDEIKHVVTNEISNE